MNYDPLDIDGQDQARDESRSRDELAQKTEIEDMKWLMNNERGRRIVWHILDRANLFGSSFSADAMSMAHSEGSKSEARRLQKMSIFYCADLFTTMLKEQGK